MGTTPLGSGHELILGGQRSGKSHCAESRAAAWLSPPGRRATLLATALPGDTEMRLRIDRHRADRVRRVPALATREVPLGLDAALRQHSAPQTLLVVDCLTLWLTNLLMPMHGAGLSDDAWQDRCVSLCATLQSLPGPVVLVSNEIGLGLSPLTAEARRFVDELGRLHQAVAALATRVTWMVAGIEVPVKGRVP